MENQPGLNSEIKTIQPRNSAKFDRWWLLVLAILVIIVLMAVLSPDPYLRSLKFFRDGIQVTLYLTLISFVLILFFGLVGGLGGWRIIKSSAASPPFM